MVDVEMHGLPRFKQPIVFEEVYGLRQTLSHPCFFTVLGYRPPKKGEWYIDVPDDTRACRSHVDFQDWSPMYIVKPTYLAIQVWKYGEEVQL